MSDEIELSDGGCIEPPEENGDIRRRDVHGNMMDVRSVGDEGWDEWADLFGVSESDFGDDDEKSVQAAQAVYDAAKAEWGEGWEHLSEKQQKDAVADALIHTILCVKVPSGSPLEVFQLLAVRSIQLVGSPS